VIFEPFDSGVHSIAWSPSARWTSAAEAVEAVAGAFQLCDHARRI
jgi:hypothetical protein